MIANDALSALKEHRRTQLKHRLRSGENWQEGDLVFCNAKDGSPLDPSWQTAVFKAAVNAAGLPTIRFHDLRHTAATLLLEKGTHPKVVSEMLGHATISITLDTYSHYVPLLHEEAADAMDAILAVELRFRQLGCQLG